ncbi:hypothetical protein ABZ734_13370 [Streptomyces sp. NPDC006660]|uniref:hypothetical protein n=1 Tax=Streptomyces sp. NPDC006660 TaxID=3156901 RepID=UPI0033EF01EE
MDATDEHSGRAQPSLDHQASGPGLFPGTGQPDVASDPEAKRTAANTIETHLEPDTKTSGSHADAATAAAVKEFGPRDGQGWATSGALKKAQATWGGQVQALMNRLGGEKSALRGTNTLFGNTDIGIQHGIARVPSPLDHY